MFCTQLVEISSAFQDAASSSTTKSGRKSCSITSTLSKESSETLALYRNQCYLRRKKTLAVLQPIHCGPNTKKEQVIPGILDGMWTTLINTATTDCMKRYIESSPTCTKKIMPKLVKKEVKKYEHSKENRVRSLRVLYNGGFIASRKYTKIRNGGDVGRKGVKSKKTVQFMNECPVPKYISLTKP